MNFSWKRGNLYSSFSYTALIERNLEGSLNFEKCTYVDTNFQLIKIDCNEKKLSKIICQKSIFEFKIYSSYYILIIIFDLIKELTQTF